MDGDVNPDCETGKHKACRGDAWNALKDEPTDCQCECHAPYEQSETLKLAYAEADLWMQRENHAGQQKEKWQRVAADMEKEERERHHG